MEIYVSCSKSLSISLQSNRHRPHLHLLPAPALSFWSFARPLHCSSSSLYWSRLVSSSCGLECSHCPHSQSAGLAHHLHLLSHLCPWALGS